MTYPQKETKEVRLFGDKSIREEAYRQKILQLENELVKLEALAKEANSVETQEKKPPEKLENLYYESLLTFDRRVKKEQEFFEKRADEVADRLETQASQLVLSLETSFKRKTRWLVLSLCGTFLVIALLSLLLFNPRIINKIDNVATKLPYYASSSKEKVIPSSRIAYLKSALETKTRYRHQYEVLFIKKLDGVYVVQLGLNSTPQSRWYLRDLCKEVSETFQTYVAGLPAELSFLHGKKLYAKSTFEKSSKKPHLQYYY